jgi:lipopolysaccharide heptosyltransferase II
MGDVLLTTPCLRAIRRRWPGARISFVVKEQFAGLLAGNPHLDELIAFPAGGGLAGLLALARTLRPRRWDLLLDLHNSLRTRLLRRLVPAARKIVYSKQIVRRSLLIYLRADLYGRHALSVPERYAAPLAPLGVSLDGLPCELYPDGPARGLFLEKISARWPSGADFLAVAPGSAWPVKCWLPERFAAAARALAEKHGLKVLLLGGRAERDICTLVEKLIGADLCLNLAGDLPLMASAAAVAASRLLLSNDTGLMHVATAVGTPVAAVFGPTTHHLGYFPYRAPSRVVETALRCRPCTHNGRRRCPLGHFRCMRRVKVEQVVRAAEELMPGA